ncbi:MAG: DivIVA domain-containing protein [Clostridia bacterium]|nr:DivIVA domain-containing protein [Clostridia bacterium]MBR4261215.1 DivIVA domain-containing protein [Clostridia bacterium]
MITPLDIENKKFSRKMVNGYDVEEVDEFLDQLTNDYEQKCREISEKDRQIAQLEKDLVHYKTIEGTLQNTLVIAQSAADEVKNTAKQQADQIIKEAESTAKQSLDSLNQSIALKQREKDEIEKQFDIYKAKMESLLISQLELIKDMKKDN